MFVVLHKILAWRRLDVPSLGTASWVKIRFNPKQGADMFHTMTKISGNGDGYNNKGSLYIPVIPNMVGVSQKLPWHMHSEVR